MASKGKVLVVDDEPDMLENLGTILKRAGYECVSCDGGAEALACLTREQPDLILTDLKMPGIDGTEVLERVRTEYGALPVIMVTGYATIEAAVQAMKRGAADFLAKPFPPEELLLKVQRVLEVSRVLDENRYLRAEMQKRRIPGLALAVVRDGAVVKMAGYGFANLEHDVPVTPDTVFELASVTKQFTATAIMVLVEDGKLQPDDPILRHLPRGQVRQGDPRL